MCTDVNVFTITRLFGDMKTRIFPFAWSLHDKGTVMGEGRNIDTAVFKGRVGGMRHALWFDKLDKWVRGIVNLLFVNVVLLTG